MGHLAVNRSGYLKVNVVLMESGAQPVTIRNVARYAFLGRFFMRLGYASELLITRDNEVKKYYVNTKSFLKHFGKMASITRKQLKEINVKDLKKIDFNRIHELYKKSTSSIIEPEQNEPSLTTVKTHIVEEDKKEVDKTDDSQIAITTVDIQKPVFVPDQDEGSSTDDLEKSDPRILEKNSVATAETQLPSESVLQESLPLLQEGECETNVNDCKNDDPLRRREELLKLAYKILEDDNLLYIEESSGTAEELSSEETLNDLTGTSEDEQMLESDAEVDDAYTAETIKELSRASLIRIRSNLDVKSFFEESEADDIDEILDSIQQSPLLREESQKLIKLREESQKLIKVRSLLALQKLFLNVTETPSYTPPVVDDGAQSVCIHGEVQSTILAGENKEAVIKSVNCEFDDKRHFQGYYLPAENKLNGVLTSADQNEIWNGEWEGGVFMNGLYTNLLAEGQILSRSMSVTNGKFGETEIIKLRSGEEIRRFYNDGLLCFVRKYDVEGLLSEKIHYGMVVDHEGVEIFDAVYRESGSFNVDNQLEGFGCRADLREGKKYRGVFVNGSRNGPFNIIDSEKDLIAIAVFQDDQMQEQNLYIGLFDSEGNAHGLGSYIDPNGDHYTGLFDTGMYNGAFTVTFQSSGNVATGTYEQGLKTGKWKVYNSKNILLFKEIYNKGMLKSYRVKKAGRRLIGEY